MSDQTQSPGEFSQWLKSNALVVLTILGVLIYAVFSIPTTFFYVSLGTTPNEVGFTYVSVLSGATLGTTLILTLLIASFLYVLMGAASVLLAIFGTGSLALFSPQIRTKDWKLDVEGFDAKLERIEGFYLREDPPWTAVKQTLRRRRELHMLADLTPAETSEMQALDSMRIYRKIFLSGFSFVIRFLRPRRWWVYAFFLLMVGATILLAMIAVGQADQIRSGAALSIGQSAFFEYHAEQVKVSPALANPPNSIQQLAHERVFLLGQNAQYVVLYLPAHQSTVRIPVNAVILTSSQ